MSSPANNALDDELEALTSIYDSSVLTILPPANTASSSIPAILALPNNVGYTFNIAFPLAYPEAPPQISGTHHVDASLKKGQGDVATAILRDVLARIWTPGQVCLFDLIEEATPLLVQHQDQHHVTENDSVSREDRSAVTTAVATFAGTAESTPYHEPEPEPEVHWILSDALVVSKSTFVARCLPVSSAAEAQASIAHLIGANKRVAAATHNITAWRIRQPSVTTSRPAGSGGGSGGAEITIQDSDDDGETAAGGRLLHLMQLMDVWNVLVVVTRWYGGVKLGPDRFRCINAVAREALVNAGFTGSGAGSEKGNAAAKKGKKGM